MSTEHFGRIQTSLPFTYHLSAGAVIVFEAKTNRYEDLVSLMKRTNAALENVVPGEATRIRA